MGKIIAVWGSPDSGKTTLAVKLAKYIYENYSAIVLVLFCDEMTPTLPVLFPNKKSDEMLSVGFPLSKTEITQDEILKSIVTVKGKMNLGFLGYKDGENKFTYPAFDGKKATDLLTILKGLVDLVVVDCTSYLDINILSSTAAIQADCIVRLATPDLKSMSFYSSQLPLYADPKYKTEQHIIGLNTIEKEVYMPTLDAKSHFKNVSFTLPYCRMLKEQSNDGDLLKTTNDKKFNKVMKMIAERVK